MSSSHQFAIMSLHAGEKNYHEVCANCLSHSAISSIDSGKGSETVDVRTCYAQTSVKESSSQNV